MKVAEKVEKKVNRMSDGTTFKYQELGIEPKEYSAAAKAIERLLKKGIINRASTGVFYKPKKTAFGDLKPREEELLRPYLFDGSKRIAYITGSSLYNKMGLTTQVPKNIKVASRGKRVITQIGNIKITPVKSYVEITNDNYELLETLDVLKDFKRIPDLDKKLVIDVILQKIKILNTSNITKLIKIALKYPPRVRAFLGALMSALKVKQNLQLLKNSINPLTMYEYGIKKEQLSTIANWNIK
jgi:hypothetical protein